jgi:hypothetical protein
MMGRQDKLAGAGEHCARNFPNVMATMTKLLPTARQASYWQ